jgi:protein-disulfide isomerase
MAPTKRKSPAAPPKNSDLVQFQIKQSHFFTLIVPGVFLLGLLLGYLIGRPTGVAMAPVAQATQPVAALPTDGAGQGSGIDDINTQLSELPRYEVAVSEDDPAYGPADAPITIVEFADFECPYCQRHAQTTHAQLLADYPDQIRFIYKDFPLSTIHPNAYSSAIAAQCALEQDAFWEYHDLLFSGRLPLGREAYDTYATELGLDMTNFAACVDEERYAEAVQADYNLAVELGVSSTPTFFINGVALVGAQPFDLFAQIIDHELAQ